MKPKNKVNVMFYGNAYFSVKVLEELLRNSENFGIYISGIITNSFENNPVEDFAKKYSIDLYNGVDTISYLSSSKADVGLVASYGRIISKEELEILKYGLLNIHGSYLPELRGSTPIQNAINDNLKYSGVTLFKMDENLDTGLILKRKKIHLTIDDDFISILNKVAYFGAEFFMRNIHQYISGVLKLIEQASYKSKVTFLSDIKVIKHKTLHNTSEEIERSYRALYPFDHVRLEINNKINIDLISIKNAGLMVFNPNTDKGSVAFFRRKIGGISFYYLKCETGYLLLDKVKPVSRGVISGEHFFVGYFEKLK